jgi:hyperosmotically inducible periplasmic protein
MNALKRYAVTAGLAILGTVAGCNTSNKSPDVTDNVRRALDQAGLKDVKVSQDRDKGVVTLTGEVANDADKTQAESIAKNAAGPQVVANEIAVQPPGQESAEKTAASDTDKGIEKNVDAVLVRHKLNKDVNYDVKNGVVTLKGRVPSEAQRKAVEKLVAGVPNVTQVVNELEIKNHKASSSS